MTSSRSARIDAPAKVNLVLDVLERRADGFHELETLFQSLELADRVRVTLHDGNASSTRDGPDSSVTLDLDGPDLGPTAENLAVRAAHAFRAAFDVPGAIHVELEKRIPAGGGLGGGSSDAAAVLKLLAALVWSEAVPAGANDRLMEIAARLGSDVPFFLRPTPLAVGRGRGELLTDWRALPRRDVVVALPPVHVPTAEAYGALARGQSAAGGAPHRSGRTGLFRNEGGAGWAEVEAAARNDFEAVVVPRHSEISASLDGMREAGASTVLLSGSGAASFGLFASPEAARTAAAELEQELGWTFIATATRTDVPRPEPG